MQNKILKKEIEKRNGKIMQLNTISSCFLSLFPGHIHHHLNCVSSKSYIIQLYWCYTKILEYRSSEH